MVARQGSKRSFSRSTVCAAPPQKRFKPQHFIDIPGNDANSRGKLQIQPAPRPAKTRRTVETADSVYRPPAHPLVPWTRARTDIYRFGFWIARIGNVCSRLRSVQTSFCMGRLLHCRVESQKRGALHLHCLCYVPQGVLELPPPDGIYRAGRERPRDVECPEARPNRIASVV